MEFFINLFAKASHIESFDYESLIDKVKVTAGAGWQPITDISDIPTGQGNSLLYESRSTSFLTPLV